MELIPKYIQFQILWIWRRRNVPALACRLRKQSDTYIRFYLKLVKSFLFQSVLLRNSRLLIFWNLLDSMKSLKVILLRNFKFYKFFVMLYLSSNEVSKIYIVLATLQNKNRLIERMMLFVECPLCMKIWLSWQRKASLLYFCWKIVTQFISLWTDGSSYKQPKFN